MDLVEGWDEYVRELSGGHEDHEAESEESACREYPSELNISDFTKLRDHYRILEYVRLIHPNRTNRPCFLAEGHVAIMSDAMRLPFRPFFRAILRNYNLCSYQLSSNFWTQAVGTWLLWQEVSPDYPMALYIFHTLFKLNKCTKRDGELKKRVKDWYYLTPKGIHSPITNGHHSSIKGASGCGSLGLTRLFF
ncbi:Uncharacterized protein Adt_31318 [Abeliophyllum distichum]|uniref:Uncharacterized protein n=1 Tax=Abeliophyllum distichum TaxID=126358 RepID=A0ABD1RF22_9LAMI